MGNSLVQRDSQKHIARSDRWHDHQKINLSAVESWISGISGGLLVAYGLQQRNRFGLVTALAGGGLIYRGTKRHSALYQLLGLTTAEENEDMPHRITCAMTVRSSPQALYESVRNLERLPQILPGVKEVVVQDATHSRWVVQAPGKLSLTWEVEITDEQPAVALAWQAHSGSLLSHQGTLLLTPAPAERGTEMRMSVEYTLPGGRLVDLVAKPLGFQSLREGLRHVKAWSETGELPTVQD